MRPGLPPLQRSASDGTQQIPTNQGLPSDTHPQPMARSASTSAGTSAIASIASIASAQHTHVQPASSSSGMADAATATQEPRMRLGLRVEQRVTVKHHVKALQQQLDRAAGDTPNFVGPQRTDLMLWSIIGTCNWQADLLDFRS